MHTKYAIRLLWLWVLLCLLEAGCQTNRFEKSEGAESILEQNGFPSRGSPSPRLRRIFDQPSPRHGASSTQEGEGGTGNPNAFGYRKGKVKPLEESGPIQRKSLNMNAALQLALRYNPSLSALRKGIGQAAAQIIQERLWPNPQLLLEADKVPISRFSLGQSENFVSLSQEFPTAGKISKRTQVAKLQRDLALLDYESAVRSLAARVQTAFIAVLASLQNEHLAQERKNVAGEIYKTIAKKVKVGETLRIDSLKASIEKSQADLAFSEAHIWVDIAIHQLSTLLGLPSLKVQHYEGHLSTLPYPPAVLGRLQSAGVFQTLPQWKASAKQIALAQARWAAALAEQYPNITLALMYGRASAVGENFAQMAVSFPIPIIDRNQGNILSARYGVLRARQEQQALQNELQSALEKSLSTYRLTLQQVRTYQKTILPQAEESLTLTRQGYQRGKFTYLDLLDAQRTLAEARQVYVRFLETLNQTAVELHRLTGIPLKGL